MKWMPGDRGDKWLTTETLSVHSSPLPQQIHSATHAHLATSVIHSVRGRQRIQEAFPEECVPLVAKGMPVGCPMLWLPPLEPPPALPHCSHSQVRHDFKCKAPQECHEEKRKCIKMGSHRRTMGPHKRHVECEEGTALHHKKAQNNVAAPPPPQRKLLDKPRHGK